MTTALEQAHRITLIDPSGVWVRCDTCHDTWSPRIHAGGSLPRDWWACPHYGCNAG